MAMAIERWENEGGRVLDSASGAKTLLRPAYFYNPQDRRRFMATAQLF
jgi:hypothetical protein